ncbi:hypothetical protein GY45DRAFT_78542 [Cubamyces sp. BRFM 1775]|nr:hypothetical protein GY45DRAFT_78542 [Cubamyces sp. BRFM 1775]
MAPLLPRVSHAVASTSPSACLPAPSHIARTDRSHTIFASVKSVPRRPRTSFSRSISTSLTGGPHRTHSLSSLPLLSPTSPMHPHTLCIPILLPSSRSCGPARSSHAYTDRYPEPHVPGIFARTPRSRAPSVLYPVFLGVLSQPLHFATFVLHFWSLTPTPTPAFAFAPTLVPTPTPTRPHP